MGGCSAGGGGSQGRGVGVGAYCYAVSAGVQFLPFVLHQACPLIMPLCCKFIEINQSILIISKYSTTVVNRQLWTGQ